MSQTHAEQQTQDTQYQQQGDEQALYDQSFLQQIAQGQTTQTVDWAREYFDAIELQVRSARRVAEIAALGQVEGRIVAKAVMMVRQQLLTEPTFVQRLAQQISTQQGSSSSSKR